MRTGKRHARKLQFLTGALLISSLLLSSRCRADEPASPASGGQTGFVGEFFSDWIERAERARAGQPHWNSPLVTVTPRLEQNLIRFDQFWQAQPHGVGQSVSGPKIKLIVSESIEVDLGAPPYVARSSYGPKDRKHGLDNWGDASFLLKYRLLAANEANGNYILTFFTGVTVPTGPNRLGAGHTVFSPTIAMGKGWGAFDIQSTIGVSVPDGGIDRLGTPLSFNSALQYCVLEKLWPQLEFNYTWSPNGQKTGETRLYLTPGIVVGRFPLWETLNFTIGTGVQVAVTRHRTSNRNWILSVRLPF